jgi:hypothetical protein
MIAPRALEAPQTNTSREPVTLDQFYGEIGISAVVAAMRYCGTHGRPANGPAVARGAKATDDVAA